MARIRSMKPELRRDLTVAEWPREVRYAWTLLWGYLDDHGRGHDDMRLVCADLFPLDRDITDRKMDRWLDLMATTSVAPGEPVLCRYVVNGRQYMHAPKWSRSQRVSHPQQSFIPACPVHESSPNRSGTIPESLPNDSGAAPEPFRPSHAGEVKGLGVKGSRVLGADPRNESGAVIEPAKPKRATTIPTDWSPTPPQVEWIKAECPAVNGKTETQIWSDWHQSKGDLAKDWNASWRTWMRKAQGYASTGPAGSTSTSSNLPNHNHPDRCPEHVGQWARTCGPCRADTLSGQAASWSEEAAMTCPTCDTPRCWLTWVAMKESDTDGWACVNGHTWAENVGQI